MHLQGPLSETRHPKIEQGKIPNITKPDVFHKVSFTSASLNDFGVICFLVDINSAKSRHEKAQR